MCFIIIRSAQKRLLLWKNCPTRLTWVARPAVVLAASESKASVSWRPGRNCAFQRGTFHEEANLCSQVGSAFIFMSVFCFRITSFYLRGPVILKAQPSVIFPGPAPGSSISEGMLGSQRFLRLLATAGESTSCQHPNINSSERNLKLTICNSPCYATEDLCHQCDLYYYYYLTVYNLTTDAISLETANSSETAIPEKLTSLLLGGEQNN